VAAAAAAAYRLRIAQRVTVDRWTGTLNQTAAEPWTGYQSTPASVAAGSTDGFEFSIREIRFRGREF